MASEQTFPNLNGTTTFFPHAYTASSVTVTIFCAITLYNACELLALIFTTFKRFTGLYFWSLLIASFGLIPYAIGFMLGYFELAPQLASEIISAVGWPMMVTGQSFVLYSRLGIVLGPANHRILKAVKAMIVFNGVVFYVSTETLVFGTFNAKDNRLWAEAYKYNEKIQMTGYSIQELILSGTYLFCVLGLYQRLAIKSKRLRVLRELFAINVLIVIMEIALLVVEYQNRHVIEQSMKGFVYSVKLKLEFAVLSKLIAMTWKTNEGSFWPLEDAETASVPGSALPIHRQSSASLRGSGALGSSNKSTNNHVEHVTVLSLEQYVSDGPSGARAEAKA